MPFLFPVLDFMPFSGIFYENGSTHCCEEPFLSYKKAHDEYFKYNVKKAQAEKMIRSNPSECDLDGNYFFTGEQADSLNKAFPFPSPKCAAIDKKRSLVYSFGQYDSTSRAVNGFSTIFLNVPLHP